MKDDRAYLNYLGIDIEVIWDITQNEVEELKIAIQSMLDALAEDEEGEPDV